MLMESGDCMWHLACYAPDRVDNSHINFSETTSIHDTIFFSPPVTRTHHRKSGILFSLKSPKVPGLAYMVLPLDRKLKRLHVFLAIFAKNPFFILHYLHHLLLSIQKPCLTLRIFAFTIYIDALYCVYLQDAK